MARKKSGTKPKSSTKSTKKPKTESKGLGDTIEKVFEATGIAKVAKWALGEDCGCDERKKKLNQLFSYRKPQCLLESEYEYLKEYFELSSNRITPTVQAKMLEIYNRVFNDRRELTTCSSCFMTGVHGKLKIVYNEYKEK
jgi:hypothetical protein